MFRKSVNSRTFSRRSLHGQIAHEIGLRIVSGAYPADSILPNEENLSAQLSVSRTAYREAIKVLAAKGLVESRPKIGTRVRPRNQWNMLDPDILAWNFNAGPSIGYARSLFEMRLIIEPAAAAMAADRADTAQLARIGQAIEVMKAAEPNSDASVQADLDFHLSILEATGNELLAPLGYLIESALAQSFKMSSGKPGAREHSVPLHEEVFLAIQARQPERARADMDALLREALQDVLDVITDQ